MSEPLLQPHLTLTMKQKDSCYFQRLFSQNISCLIYSAHYVTMSRQLNDASKILKSEASISRVKQEKCDKIILVKQTF